MNDDRGYFRSEHWVDGANTSTEVVDENGQHTFTAYLPDGRSVEQIWENDQVVYENAVGINGTTLQTVLATDGTITQTLLDTTTGVELSSTVTTPDGTSVNTTTAADGSIVKTTKPATRQPTDPVATEEMFQQDGYYYRTDIYDVSQPGVTVKMTRTITHNAFLISSEVWDTSDNYRHSTFKEDGTRFVQDYSAGVLRTEEIWTPDGNHVFTAYSDFGETRSTEGPSVTGTIYETIYKDGRSTFNGTVLGPDGVLYTVEKQFDNRLTVPYPSADNGRPRSENGLLRETSTSTVTGITVVTNYSGSVSQAPSWQQVSGAASEIACGGDGSIWAIGTNHVGTASDFGIYQWDGVTWQNRGGGAVRIAVDGDGQAWVVNSEGAIFRREGDWWVNVPGGGKDIGAGADGSVWLIGNNPIGSDFGIYQWDGTTWLNTGGQGVRIAVGGDGQPWLLNAAGQVFHHQGQSWLLVRDGGKEISVGADGSIWLIGT